MPRCLNCGNTEVFESTAVQGVLYPAMGLMGHFNNEGRIINIENRGMSPEMLEVAVNRPEAHFDLCPQCGSKGIIWP